MGYWRHTCILLVEHSAQGAVGVLLTASSSLRKPAAGLRALCDLQQPPLEASKILSGGPCGFDPYVLHDRRRIDGARQIGDGVWVGGGLEALVDKIGDDEESSADEGESSEETVVDTEEEVERANGLRPVRCFHGCALWGGKQLEKEIRRGGWDAIPRAALPGGALAQLVFCEPPKTCWEAARRLVEPTTTGVPRAATTINMLEHMGRRRQEDVTTRSSQDIWTCQ